MRGPSSVSLTNVNPLQKRARPQVKVESKQTEMLHHACQQFLGMSDAQIKSIILQTLEGHQRAIMGKAQVELGAGGAGRPVLRAGC